MAARRWAELPWPAFRTLPAHTLAVLPVAAIEQHGPHLPVAVDATINAGVLDAALALLPDAAEVLVLPAQVVGCSIEHIRFPGTLTATPETLLALWTEIGLSVARAGVRRLLILNSHGGQPQIVDLVCRRLRAEARMFAVGTHWARLGRPPGLVAPQEARHGIHAGLIETSLMLCLDPAAVEMREARDFRSAWLAQEGAFPTLEPEGAVGFGWEIQDLHPAGALGDAAAATAALGVALRDHAAARLAALMAEICAFDIDGWLRVDA